MAALEIGLGLAFAAAVLKATQSVFMKRNAIDTDEYVTAWASRIFAVPLLFAAVYFQGIPAIDRGFGLFLLATTVLITAASVFIAKAHKVSDISLIMPIMAFSPALLLITSPIIVGQYASPPGAIGVLVVALGAYYLKSEDAESVLAPFRKLFEDRGVQMISIVVAIYSVTANIDKLAVEASSAVFWALSVNALSAAFLMPLMMKKNEEWFSDTREYLKPLFVLGALGGATVIFQFTALKFTLVPYVIGVKRLSIPISVILGILIFKEEDSRRRLIGSGIMVIGAIIIYLSL